MITQRNRRLPIFQACTVAAVLSVLPGAVRAQSSVTLYGILDTSLFYTNHTFNPRTRASGGHVFSLTDSDYSSSRFGLKGREDLGGGTAAIFALESGFSTSNGALGNSNGNFFGRMAYVGLTGPYGTVKMGEQYSPFALSLLNTEPRGASFFGSGAVIYIGSVFTTGLFTPNAISYTSPKIAGFEGSGMIALGGQAGNFQAGRQYSARLTYTMPHLVVDAALFSGNSGGSAASTPIPTTVAFTGRTIGAVSNWGNAIFNLSYTNYKVASSFDEQVYMGGFRYTFTPAFAADGGVWWIHDGNAGTNHSLLAAAGVTYSLSARTMVYGELAMVNNHGRLHTGLSVNGALYEPTGSSTGATIGIRHLF
ncbi:putative porin [Paraburkholderia sp. GAS348]|nr:porin [Paraburkholderia phytofirmans]